MTWLSLVPREDLLPWLPTEQLATFAVEEVHRFLLDRWKLQGFLLVCPCLLPRTLVLRRVKQNSLARGFALVLSPHPKAQLLVFSHLRFFFFFFSFALHLKGDKA